MSDDIVKRLRNGPTTDSCDAFDLVHEAADEIERLQARIAALEEALAAIKLLTSWSKKKVDHRLPVVKEAHELACAALAKGGR